METQAEEKKNLGNEEFKKGNYQKAIKFYTEAISKYNPSLTNHILIFIELKGYSGNAAIYTNRAASYIQLKDFTKALADCNQALNLNPQFGKAYKRMFRCYLSMGQLDVSLNID